MLRPEVAWRAPFAVCGRVTVHTDHGEPFQCRRYILVETAGDVCSVVVNNLGKAAVYLVAQRIREEPLQVPLDDAARLRVALRHLADVLNDLIDGGLSAHSLAVVECTRMQDIGDVRCQGVAQQMVGDAPVETGGEYLAPLGHGRKEGIVMVNAEGLLLQLTHHAHQQRCPVALKVRTVAPVAFVAAGFYHRVEQNREKPFFSHKFIRFE